VTHSCRGIESLEATMLNPSSQFSTTQQNTNNIYYNNVGQEYVAVPTASSGYSQPQPATSPNPSFFVPFESTTTQMISAFGQQVMKQQNVSSWISWPINKLRPYFQVTTHYVFYKIRLIVFPFGHKVQRIGFVSCDS
jgi:YIF1